jgi:hypothetical protein
MTVTPFRDDLAAMRARLELLESAVRDGSCEECAARRARARRRPLGRIVLACTIGLAALAAVLFFLVTVSESLKHPF